MFLTPQEIQTLTGYQFPSRQIQWLKGHGWRYEVSRIGKPCVSRSYAESKLSDAPATSKPVMNLEAIRKRA